MPSPFPGMDPYVETPALWLEFHNNLAGEIQGELNRVLDPRYRAGLTPYVSYEVVEVAQIAGMFPDVAVWRRQHPGGQPTSAAVATPAPVESAIPLEAPVDLYRVEIHTTGTQQLVTVIEILSPGNKRPGHESAFEYRRKRSGLLRSAVHLIEIDLLRGGERPPLKTPVPPASYYVVLSRADQRPRVGVWPIQLADTLPILPVPLLDPDPDVSLDLGAAFRSVYERCAYSRVIDYRLPPPPPPLSEEEAAWVDQLLREKGLRAASPDTPK